MNGEKMISLVAVEKRNDLCAGMPRGQQPMEVA